MHVFTIQKNGHPTLHLWPKPTSLPLYIAPFCTWHTIQWWGKHWLNCQACTYIFISDIITRIPSMLLAHNYRSKKKQQKSKADDITLNIKKTECFNSDKGLNLLWFPAWDGSWAILEPPAGQGQFLPDRVSHGALLIDLALPRGAWKRANIKMISHTLTRIH